MTLTEIETATAAWINAVRGARVLVKGRIGEAAAPEAPYVMFAANLVEMPDFVAVGFGDVLQTARAPDSRIEIAISVVGDIAAGSHSARNDAVQLVLSLRHSQRSADIFARCGLAGVSTIQNLSAVEVGAMRQRYDMTVTLSAILTADAPSETVHTITTGVHELTIPAQVNITVTEP